MTKVCQTTLKKKVEPLLPCMHCSDPNRIKQALSQPADQHTFYRPPSAWHLNYKLFHNNFNTRSKSAIDPTTKWNSQTHYRVELPNPLQSGTPKPTTEWNSQTHYRVEIPNPLQSGTPKPSTDLPSPIFL